MKIGKCRGKSQFNLKTFYYVDQIKVCKKLSMFILSEAAVLAQEIELTFHNDVL